MFYASMMRVEIAYARHKLFHQNNMHVLDVNTKQLETRHY